MRDVYVLIEKAAYAKACETVGPNSVEFVAFYEACFGALLKDYIDNGYIPTEIPDLRSDEY